MGLTAQQQMVYEALVEATTDGWPASLEHVTELAGYASKSTTHAHMHELVRLGYAQKHPRMAKGGWMPLTPA